MFVWIKKCVICLAEGVVFTRELSRSGRACHAHPTHTHNQVPLWVSCNESKPLKSHVDAATDIPACTCSLGSMHSEYEVRGDFHTCDPTCESMAPV